MTILFLLGRVIFGFFWINAGYRHFKNADMMAGYSASKGVPSAKAAVIGTGILAILGGLSMLLGLWPTIGIILIAVFLLGVTFNMHAYWKIQDPAARSAESINFRKNMGLLGATLMFLAISEPWMWSLHF